MLPWAYNLGGIFLPTVVKCYFCSSEEVYSILELKESSGCSYLYRIAVHTNTFDEESLSQRVVGVDDGVFSRFNRGSSNKVLDGPCHPTCLPNFWEINF